MLQLYRWASCPHSSVSSFPKLLRRQRWYDSCTYARHIYCHITLAPQINLNFCSGTIENYQGVEQDVIIFSLTRSNQAFVDHDIKRRMGVFGNVRYKQANVALTRAENLFIMIGNPEPMWNDSLWRQWLIFCFRNGLWYGQPLDDKEMQMISSCERIMISSPHEEKGDGMSTIVSTLEKLHRLT